MDTNAASESSPAHHATLMAIQRIRQGARAKRMTPGTYCKRIGSKATSVAATAQRQAAQSNIMGKPSCSSAPSGALRHPADTARHTRTGAKNFRRKFLPAKTYLLLCVSSRLSYAAPFCKRPGRLLAQAEMVPAPRHTTISPGRACSRTSRTRSSSPITARAWR